jgi:hypothetical protein
MSRRYGHLILCNGILAALVMLGWLNHLSAQTVAPLSYALVNGWWFNGQAFERRAGFSVNGRFTFNTPPRVDRTLDLADAYVVPPFAEAHNHNLGTGAEDRDKATIQRYLADGVFYVKIQGNLPLTEEMKDRMSISQPNSVDATFAQAFLTATGGHPIPLIEDVLLPAGYAPGYTKGSVKDFYYFTIDSEADLQDKWPGILRLRPDFIKTFLLFSDQFEQRKSNPAYRGQKGLDPRLLSKIVAKAHADHLRVSTHVANAADFHFAVAAGVDEIAHLPPVGDVPIAAADARLAADRGVIVDTTYFRAVPTLIRMQVVSEAEVRAAEAANLKLLLQNGVSLAIGSDDATDTSVKEIEYLQSLGVFDNLTLLRMWSAITPRTIFPERQIGALQEGFEASFLALEGDPLKDFSNVRRIKIRFKQGLLLDAQR